MVIWDPGSGGVNELKWLRFFLKRPADLKPRILVVRGCIFKVTKKSEKKLFFRGEISLWKKNFVTLDKSFSKINVNFTLILLKDFVQSHEVFFSKWNFTTKKKVFFSRIFSTLKIHPRTTRIRSFRSAGRFRKKRNHLSSLTPPPRDWVSNNHLHIVRA